ncbi:MAG: hypothetical protein AB3N20_06675 [Rhizobiaceae bacterium]
MARNTVSPPISGEILASANSRSSGAAGKDRDIVEAEYETVVDRRQRPDRIGEPDERKNDSLFGLDILAGGDAAERGGSAGPVFWLVSVILVCAAFWISGGHSLVSNDTFQIASVPEKPLAIKEVRSRVLTRGSNTYLLVEGTVLNSGAENLPLPGLIIQVKASDGNITRYKIAGGSETILAGGNYAFSSRLSTPQSGVENVKVIIGD